MICDTIRNETKGRDKILWHNMIWNKILMNSYHIRQESKVNFFNSNVENKSLYVDFCSTSGLVNFSVIISLLLYRAIRLSSSSAFSVLPLTKSQRTDSGKNLKVRKQMWYQVDFYHVKFHPQLAFGVNLEAKVRLEAIVRFSPIFTSVRRLCFHLYLSVCLSVARISQNVLDRFSCKLVEGLAMDQWPTY